jgi:hypothetical protein
MLMTMKALAVLFGILTIINIPVCISLAKSSVFRNLNQEITFTNFFARLSLGNIDLSSSHCDKAILYTESMGQKGAPYLNFLLHGLTHSKE